LAAQEEVAAQEAKQVEVKVQRLMAQGVQMMLAQVQETLEEKEVEKEVEEVKEVQMVV
jgi:hypothetical protein